VDMNYSLITVSTTTPPVAVIAVFWRADVELQTAGALCSRSLRDKHTYQASVKVSIRKRRLFLKKDAL
jgi:hypothetical protein